MESRQWAGRTPSLWFRVALLVGSAAVLVAVAVGAGGVGPWVGRTQTDPTLPSLSFDPPTLPTTPSFTVPPDLGGSGGGDFRWLLYLLAGVLAAALLTLLAIWWRQRGRTATSGRHQIDAPDVPTTIALPGGDLPFDPRAAATFVIECWQTVERTAARAGTPRTDQQTPTEFLRALADTYPMDRAVAARLLRAYHHARFDHVALGPDSARAARDDAEAICRAVGSAVLARSAGGTT